jgi:hypothetical protein
MQSARLTGFGLLLLAIGDWTDNNRVNLVVFSDDSNSIGAFLGYNNGSFAQQIVILTGFSSSAIPIGNFNNNNPQEVIAVNSGIHLWIFVSIYANNYRLYCVFFLSFSYEWFLSKQEQFKPLIKIYTKISKNSIKSIINYTARKFRSILWMSFIN